MTVGDICTRFVVTADPDETIVEAARRMRDRHVGDLLVTDSQHRPVGILTDRDIVVAAVVQSQDRLDALRIGDVMSRDLITVRATDSIDVALKTMRTHGIRRLPVISTDGRVEGLLAFDDVLSSMSESIGQLVGLVAREQRRERELRR
jgi:CBS domain-containing protein